MGWRGRSDGVGDGNVGSDGNAFGDGNCKDFDVRK